MLSDKHFRETRMRWVLEKQKLILRKEWDCGRRKKEDTAMNNNRNLRNSRARYFVRVFRSDGRFIFLSHRKHSNYSLQLFLILQNLASKWKWWGHSSFTCLKTQGSVNRLNIEWKILKVLWGMLTCFQATKQINDCHY